jgi:hypothetical protein
MRSIEPGISRFRVCACGASRNDAVGSSNGDWLAIVAPAFPTVIFVAASILGLFAPHLSRYVWPLAFVAPILAAYVEHREKRHMEG